MKKKLLFFSVLLVNINFFAQENPYISFTTMEDYNELTNPISVNDGEIWDEETIYTIDFDFDFLIYDHNFSSINVHAGGDISFPGYGYKRIFVYHTPFGGHYLRDKGITSSISKIDYEVVGEEGQYIIKIQWENAGFVQWFSTSDTSDYVDFQIWIYQEDASIQLRFGSNQTDPGTYGYPEAQSDPDPGPSPAFRFDSCHNVLHYYSDADDPSTIFLNVCYPNYAFIDGTPSEGITYTIIQDYYVGIANKAIDNISLFPNPAINTIHIKGIPEISDVESLEVLNVYGKILLKADVRNSEDPEIHIDLRDLPAGIYFLKVNARDYTFTKEFIKKNQGN